ncbi:hypothetical protein [Amycolatopsis sp. NPDC004378]
MAELIRFESVAAAVSRRLLDEVDDAASGLEDRHVGTPVVLACSPAERHALPMKVL